jgi:hypothetical protein
MQKLVRHYAVAHLLHGVSTSAPAARLIIKHCIQQRNSQQQHCASKLELQFALRQ